MPRSVNPGDIRVGKGRAPQGTVEDNSLRNPDRDVLPLNAHIHDPSRAHFAVSIAIEDVANNFSSDEVEGALAELAGSTSAGRVNGLLTGGGFSSVGLTLTLDTPTTVLLNGTEQDFSGQSVVLANNATQFVYIDVSSGTLVTNPTAPTMVSEDILIAEVTTAAGAVTGSRDGRWFVLNIDRKPPLTVRSSGSAFNQASEANFVSLEAALLYLEQYAGAGADPMETHRILVRGAHTISSTLTIPVDGVIFEGEGAGEFVDATGGSTMFTITGRDNLQFRNLTFTANNASTVALAGDDPITGLIVENCRFEADGDSFGAIANIASVAVSGAQRILFRNNFMACYDGIQIGRPTNCRIVDCFINGAGGASGSNVGIDLGASAFASQGRNQVRGCRLAGFETGIVSADDYVTVENTEIENTEIGIASTGTEPTFNNVTITLDSTDGFRGITTAGTQARVLNCRITNPRTVWTGINPIGIFLTSGDGSVISGCYVDGFLDDVTPEGTGIYVAASPNVQVSDCTSRNAIFGIEVDTTSNNVEITNCRIEDVSIGVNSSGDYTYISNTDIDLSANDDATGAQNGVVLTDASSRVIGCRISCNRRWLAGPTGDDPSGVLIGGAADGSAVEGCDIIGFYNETDVLGQAVLVSTGANNIRVADSTLSCYKGIVVNSSSSEFTAADNLINATAVGIEITSTGSDHRHLIDNCRIELGTALGLVGISLDTCDHVQISNCNIWNRRTTFGAPDLPVGIDVATSTNVSIDNCHVLEFYNSTGNSGFGIRTVDTSAVAITNCNIVEANMGITLGDATPGGGRVTDCRIRNIATGVNVELTRTIIHGCNIDLDSTRGLSGIVSSSDANRMRVTDCDIDTSRAWTTEVDVPYGIFVAGDNSRITGNTIVGFNNDGTSPGGAGIALSGVSGIKVADNTVGECYDGIVLTVSGGLTQCSVEDNSVLGGEITRYGIWVDGTSANPSRDLVLNDNVVHSCLGASIRVDGQMDNSTINGNSLDGFIPVLDIDHPTAEGIHLVAAVGASSHGLTISGNSIWRCRNAVSLQGLATDFHEDITVTGNTLRYCGYPQGLFVTIPDTYEGAGSKGVGAEYVTNLKVSANTIRQIGQLIDNAGAELFPFDSVGIDDVQSNGVYLRNCLNPHVTNNRLLDLRADGLTNAGTIEVPAFSIRILVTSTGLGSSLVSTGMTISDNEIYRTPSLAGHSQRGLLVYSDLGTDVGLSHGFRETMIQNNILAGTALGLVGIEFDLSDTSFIEGLVISGNHIEGPGFIGGNPSNAIFISKKGTGNTRNLQITDNQIVSTSGDGIKVSQEQNNLQYVTISGNQLNGVNTTGISIEFLGANFASDIKVENNQILLAEEYGIDLDFGTTAAWITRVSVSGNQLFSEYLTTNDNIRVAWENCEFYGLEVSNNQILGETEGNGASGTGGIVVVGTGTPSTATAGLYNSVFSNNTVHMDSANNSCLDIQIAGPFTDMTVSDNQFRNDGGTSRNVQLVNIHPDVTPPNDELCERIAFRGNLFEGAEGVHLSFDGFKLREVAFTNNVLTNSGAEGLRVDTAQADLGTTPTVVGMDLSNNTVRTTLSEGFYMFFLDATTINGLVVNENKFAQAPSSGTPRTIRFIHDGTVLRASTFDGNSFHLCGDSDASTGRIALNVGQMESVSISNNVMTDCGSVGIRVEDQASAGAWSFENLKINGNEMYNQRDSGIVLDFTAFFLTSQLTVNDNILRKDFAAAALDCGIFIQGSTGSGLLNNFSICGNSIENFEGTNQGLGAISLEIAEDLTEGRICNNNISQSDTSGIYLEVDGQLENVNIDGNVVDNVGGTGIYVIMTGTDPGAAVRGFSISDNQLTDCDDHGIYYDAQDSGGQVVSTTNFKVDGNLIYNPGINGIFIDTDDGITSVGSSNQADILTSSVSGNLVQGLGVNTTGDGIRIQVEGSLDVFSADKNVIRNVSDNGLLVQTFAGAIRNTTVSGNQVQDCFQGNSGSNFKGVALKASTSGNFTGAWFCNEVANNSIFLTGAGTNSGPYGIELEVNSTCRCVTVTGNNVHFNGNGAGATRGYNFLAQNNGFQTPSQLQWTITGNNARGCGNAVVRPVTDFDLSISTCNGNTSDDPGNDWHDFVALMTDCEDGSGVSTNNPPS